jgi:hypothetical protein
MPAYSFKVIQCLSFRRHSGYNEVGGAGEDMTRGRPSRAAEGERGGEEGGGGEGVRVYSTVQYTPYTYKTPRVQTRGGGVGAGQPAYSQLVSEFGGINT